MSEIDNDYGNRVAATNLDATTPENARICKELGFKNHGIVIRDSAGGKLWSQPDHDVVIDDVRNKLDELTGGP